MMFTSCDKSIYIQSIVQKGDGTSKSQMSDALGVSTMTSELNYTEPPSIDTKASSRKQMPDQVNIYILTPLYNFQLEMKQP